MLVRAKARYRTLTLWDEFFEQKMADNLKMFGLSVPNEAILEAFYQPVVLNRTMMVKLFKSSFQMQ